VSIHVSGIRRKAGIGIVGVITAAAIAASPASSAARPPMPAKAAALTCDEVNYSDRTQAPPNAAGVIFEPKGDVLRVWDNDRDNKLVKIWFNYAGVNDKWKYVGAPSDGGQGPIVRNVAEKYKEICFYIATDSPKYIDSPIVRYTTRP
jgi:hypothetical protein